MDVLIFKTSVASKQEVSRVHPLLTSLAEIKQYNFDLEDCDRILRIKCINGKVSSSCLIELLKNLGFYAEVLT